MNDCDVREFSVNMRAPVRKAETAYKRNRNARPIPLTGLDEAYVLQGDRRPQSDLRPFDQK